MNTDVEMPEQFSDAIWYLSQAMARLDEPLTDAKLTEIWRLGLRRAGIRAERAKGAWNGKYRPELPFVLEFPCPFEHRTPDRYDVASVRIIIEHVAWWSLDPASPCTECGAHAIARWLPTCPRCVAGEDSARHYPDHDAFDVTGTYEIPYNHDRDFEYDDTGGFDASPVSWVAREFLRMTLIARARWWVEHTEEALDAHRAAGMSESVRQAVRRRQLEWARDVLATQPKARGASSSGAAPKEKQTMTTGEAVAWLDALTDSAGVPLVAATHGEKATWAAVKTLPGCPAQSVVYGAVKLRKRRATEP
jgi:hypothetical protein